MKTILRTLPALLAAVIVGTVMDSPAFHQLPVHVLQKEIGYILGATVALTLIVVALTRGKPKQQNTGFGSPARPRARTGRN